MSFWWFFLSYAILYMIQVNSSPNVLQKMARVVKEKASQDYDRIVKGTEKTRAKLGVLEELFTYWNLEDADDELEELEDALIVRLYWNIGAR